MQSPPFPRYLFLPRSKYSPEHHVLKHPQLRFLPQCQRLNFTPIQNNRQNFSSINTSSRCFFYVSFADVMMSLYSAVPCRDEEQSHKFLYRVILSLETPNDSLCIQSKSAGFSFVNTGKQVHLKHVRRHFERNLVKDVHHRSVASRNWLESYRQMKADLTPADFFVWGLLKGEVYKNTPRKIEQFKDAIRQEIQTVNFDILGKVFQNLEKRIQVCLDVKGDQFQHRL